MEKLIESGRDLEVKMKRLVSIVMTLCALAAAVFFGLLAGTQFLQLLSGPKALKAGEGFAQASGKYISYEAAYPVASCVEEYYSGDATRVRTTGFVVYDEQRQAFLYIIVPDDGAGQLKDIIWNLHLVTEMRAGKDMEPVSVSGTLEPMPEDAVRRAMRALEDSELLSLYSSLTYSGEIADSDYELYAGDAYGQTAYEAMTMALDPEWQQAEWYCIKKNTVSGLGTAEIWICILAAGVSLLLFFARLIMLIAGGGKNTEKNTAAVSGGKVEQLLNAQLPWVREWCRRDMEKNVRYAYLAVVGAVVVLGAIGVIAGSFEQALTLHVPLGVLIGEGMAVLFWLTQRERSNPAKILARLRKGMKKQLPGEAEQEEFAEDALEAGGEWSFGERNKDSEIHGIVGSRYWFTFSTLGAVTIAQVSKLKRIKTEMVSGEIKVNKVRTQYMFFMIQFFYQNTNPKKACDCGFSFQSNEVGGRALEMMKKRVGDSVEIEEGFSKDVKYSM